MKSNPLWLVVQLSCLGCEKAPASTHPDVAPSTERRTNEALPVAPASGSPAFPLQKPVASEDFKTPLPDLYRNHAVPCKRFAALSSSACKEEVQTRKLPVKRALGKTYGIETPLELAGPLNGVSFELPRGLYGFMDCRLVLLLDQLAGELKSFGVVTVQVNNTYRPASVLPPKTPPTKAPAKTAALPTSKGVRKVKARTPPVEPTRLSQHARGLAVDITEFRISDGRALNVERDFHGTRGASPCGSKAQVGSSDTSATLLRDITCAIARAGLCNHLITPNRDEAHENHLHCDIEAKASEVTVE